MINFREEIAKLLEEQIGDLDYENILKLIETPPNSDMGDYAFPAFSLAPILKKSPVEIAQDLADKIKSKYFKRIVATGPYLNFFIDEDILKSAVLGEIKTHGTDYGKSDQGAGKTVLVEYSSPNIAKAFHIGHLRSTVIGSAIANLYEFLGYDTVRINHLGDYGTQFGLLLTAYTRWGDPDKIKENPIPELLELYIRINSEIEEDEELLKESHQWFRKLEEGDKETVELWEFFRDESLKEFYRVYDMLGIHFDSHKGEAFYSDKMDPIIKELEDKNLLEESDDAMIVDLEEYDLTPMLVQKSDGSTLYSTRDLAAGQYRHDEYDFYKNIYVVGSQQILHFKQLFAVLELMGKDYVKDMEHVSFGMVSLPEGTMSTRRGNVIYLEDVLNEAINKTSQIIEDRDIDDKEQLAKDIGIGAVVFQELWNDRNRDYVFDWDEILNFEGETGPYVQYTHARIASILRNGDFDPETEVDYSLLDQKREIEIIKHLYNFNSVIGHAAATMQPFFVTRFITELAQLFNSYYANTRIVGEDEDLTAARMFLAYCVKTVIKTGLGLIGINAPERM